MSDSRAFVKTINPQGSGGGEDVSIHQTSPGWVLTFVRWENRDTFRVSGNNFDSVREPLVVENDCISVTVTSAKGTLTPSMSATLIMTDVNYETAVAPGDFVFVNMLNWLDGGTIPNTNHRVKGARDIGDAARAKRPINGPDDGFKGIFKVQGVRKVLTVDPNNGTKIVLFKINGFAFTEFNNTIYFNQALIDPSQDQKNALLFASFLGQNWTNLVNSKGFVSVQDIVAILIQSFIGNGIKENISIVYKPDVVNSENTHFLMPQLVGSLLGVDGVKAAKDIFIYLFGIQDYAAGSTSSLANGMNPQTLIQQWPRFFYTGNPCPGHSFLKPEYWNQVKAWSILNQYTNSPVNELFTCFRISPSGSVMPTVVFRQIPFTTEDYKDGGIVTRYLNLPRWKVNPALIIELDIGRDESARINFVQYFGRSTVSSNGSDISSEVAQGNYKYDPNDVLRSGLRPYVVSTQFDEPSDQDKEYHSPEWAKIVGDALIGGHLKLNGHMMTAGIEDPIAVGDNLEFDGVVYHIEQIAHTCSMSISNGRRTFRTSITLSSGIDISSSANGTRYAEMTDTVSYRQLDRDNKNNKILPGISEEQDVVYRPWGPWPTDQDVLKTNSPFPQPNTKQGGQSDNGDKT